MAQAVGLEEELQLLISLQKFAANFVLRTIDNALSDNNVLLVEKAFGLPKNLLRFSWRGSTDCMDTLRNHAQNNVYNFFGGFCSIRVNKAASAITNRTAMYIPICSEYFPEKLKKRNEYKQTAKAITNIIARHAATGEYKINVEFEILGVKATDDKPEYFCDAVEFYISTIRGNNQVFSPKQVPAHLIDANFHNACFRAAMALHIAINMTWEKFCGFDTPFRKDVVIDHNLPNYPPIIAYQKLVKYE